MRQRNIVTAIVSAAIGFSLALGWGAVGLPPTVAVASQQAVAADWLDRGRDRYQLGQIEDAIAAWNEAARLAERAGARQASVLSRSYLSLAYQDLGDWTPAASVLDDALARVPLDPQTVAPSDAVVYGQLYNTLGNLQLNQGQTDAALSSWQNAERWYARAGDRLGVLGTQIDRAQALQVQGLYPRSQSLLNDAMAQLETLPPSAVKATGLLSLGNTLYALGQQDDARQALDASLTVAAQLDEPFDRTPIFLSLGNAARADGEVAVALSYYREAQQRAQTLLARVEAATNALSLGSAELDDALSFARVFDDLRRLSPSRRAIYARIHFAQSWLDADARARQNNPSRRPDLPQTDVAQLLADGIRQARELSDPRAEAYALGQLGRLYEYSQQWTDAQQLTERAIAIAQRLDAADILARWQWQLGRVLRQQDAKVPAIAAYRSAIDSLQVLRRDLAAIAPDAQFSFRDSVEPVYRQLVELLLTPETPGTPPSQENLTLARETIELLQLAEIDNFFREACLDNRQVAIDDIDDAAAAFYPIVLDDRLAVILSRPGQPLRYHETRVPADEVNRTLESMVQYLNPVFPESRRLPVSQQLYDWLVRPFEDDLDPRQTRTLVFVLDGLLRNLPMAVLHDGENYLLERYGVAIAPSLQLLETEREVPTADQLALVAGLSESVRGYSALPAVKDEVEAISSLLVGETLLNRRFTSARLQQQVGGEPFSVLHLATHGQFSSNADETYLVAWDERIQVKDLDRLLRSRETGNAAPIELLVLSACQTAAGDRQAALGLAGFAVRSGARSTLATLWSVNDRSTADLMREFYAQLRENPGQSKAESLRQAQLMLLRSPEYGHPFYWSPFVLVGNWL